MADFTALKAAINAAIKTNGEQEITGAILQTVLDAIVETLGEGAINDLITALSNEATARGNADATLGGSIDGLATSINAINTKLTEGYIYAGIATPSTNPGTPTGKVFYLALTAGTYTNFGSIEVSQGINILKYNGSAWSLDAFVGIDDELTPSSNKLPKSGNVLDNIIKNGSAFDLSSYNAVDGVLATYANLDAALAALNLLPAVYKQPGMSFRFVSNIDNKYVQYRLMSDTFNTTPANWQGVDDEPTAGSNNLVKSGGVEDDIFNNGLFERHNTISYAVGDSYLWKTIFSPKLIQGKRYRLSIQMNSPSNIKFSLCTDSTNDVQTIITGTNVSTSVGFIPQQSNTFLRARCGNSIEAATGEINVSLLNLDGNFNKLTENVVNIRKTVFGEDALNPIDYKKYALAIKVNDGGRFITQAVDSQYHKGAYHYSYIYDVSQLVGRTIYCYTHQKTNIALYAFVKDYTAIKSTYDSEAWATNAVEVVVGSDSIGSVISVTVPTGANQLILCGSDTDKTEATLTIPNIISGLSEALQTEVTNRTSADNALANQINGINSAIVGINSNITNLRIEVDGNITLTPIEIKDDKAIVSNSSSQQYGSWRTVDFIDYENVRPTPVAGTKYVSKIYDTRGFIGKELNFHFAPRNNIYGVVFVSDYESIPTSTDVETWESIYKGGRESYGAIESQDHTMIVPEGGNYCVVTGTDLDPATAITGQGLIGEVEEIKQYIGVNTTSIVALNGEKETLYKLNNAKRVGRSGNTESGITPLTLLHFSDIHGREANLSRIKEFYDYYKTNIDDVICTGDMVTANITSGMQFWNNANVDNFLMCIGNHDAYANGNHDDANPQDVYNTFIKPYVSNWDVVQPNNAEENALCYYYKDYTDAHIRLIVLDCYAKGDNNYITTENTWFASVLADAITQSLSVICAIHPCTGDVDGFKCSFNAYQKGYSGTSFSSAFKSSVNTFINNGGDFIAWIGGHGHIDVCGTVEDYPNQTIIAIDTASSSTSSAYSDTYRSTNQKDKAFDLFNLMTIDPYQKLIKIIRIGADIDSWMRKKDMVTIQYASSTANPIEAPTVINPYD